MRNYIKEQYIFRVGAKPQATFTAATSDIITSNGHGLSQGDCVQFTTTTTLPAGLSLVTNYYVIEPTTNTFKVSATLDGPTVDITDTGTGTHSFNLKGHKILCVDFNDIQLGFNSIDSADLTVKIQGSNQEDVDFNAAQSSTNRWDYVQVKDLEDNSALDGDTGIVLSGTDDNRQFEINSNAFLLISARITAYAAGRFNLVANLFNE